MPDLERFGFRFWLAWILGFAGSFLVSAIFWTWILTSLFGNLSQPELVLTWALSVFGCWFLLLTPFMRKKEQIWKRLNTDEEKAVDAWLGGMGFFLALLIAACIFWDWQLRPRIFAGPGFDPLWGKYVFSTWLALTLPFLVFLYKKADQIHKAAVTRQTHLGPKFQSVFVEKSKRTLSETIAQKVRSFPETMHEGHVVNATLKDGRRISNIFIFCGREVLGLYNVSAPDFEMRDIIDVEPVENLPAYEESKWLRLDGRA